MSNHRIIGHQMFLYLARESNGWVQMHADGSIINYATDSWLGVIG